MIPSITGPGSVLAAVLMTDNPRHTLIEQVTHPRIMVGVLPITL